MTYRLANNSQAKIAGMTEDLELSSSDYEWLLTAFYVTYIVRILCNGVSLLADKGLKFRWCRVLNG